MGYYTNRSGGTGAPFAPLYLYMRSVAKGGAPGMGLYPDKALQEATASGVNTQDDYVQGVYGYQTAPTAAEIANAANYKLSGWNALWVGDKQGDKARTAIRTAIAAGSPVAIGIPVFKDFMYLKGNTIYNTVTGSSLGGHMITAYAYDADGVWIRNQWGTGWGASGDAHLSWSFVTTDVQAGHHAGWHQRRLGRRDLHLQGLTFPTGPVPLFRGTGPFPCIPRKGHRRHTSGG